MAELATPLAQFRWLVSGRNDYERVLQQLVRVHRGDGIVETISTEWRDVPEVPAPTTPPHSAEDGHAR